MHLPDEAANTSWFISAGNETGKLYGGLTWQ